MFRIFIASGDGLRIVEWDGPPGAGRRMGDRALPTQRALEGVKARDVASLPDGPVLCATRDGLYRETSEGSWSRDPGFPGGTPVTALASGEARVLWAGTEPSAVFRASDTAERWERRPGLDRLPSASEWSYPPHPDTHHVRSLAPRPGDADALLVGIEAGAVVRTLDGGETWEDRRPDGPRDPHRMVVHPAEPDRVLVAAGDGVRETRDFGGRWVRFDQGIGDAGRYAWDLAVEDGRGSHALLVAASGPAEAHGRAGPASRLFRRRLDGAADTPWQDVTPAWPDLAHRRVPSLAALPETPDGYLMCTQEGELVFTLDSGETWRPLQPDPSTWAGIEGVARIRVI